MAVMSWTDADVEAVAQASVRDLLPPLDILQRLGPNPPHEYLIALGGRVRELMAEPGERTP